MAETIDQINIPPGMTNIQLAEALIRQFADRVLTQLDFELAIGDRTISPKDAEEIDRFLHEKNSGLFFLHQTHGGQGNTQDIYTLGRVSLSGPIQEA